MKKPLMLGPLDRATARMRGQLDRLDPPALCRSIVTSVINSTGRVKWCDQHNCKILLEELAERSDAPFVRFNLGSIAMERKDWAGALDYLRHSLARSATTDSITRKLFALIARAHQMMGNTPGALAVCAEGLSFDADDAEILFRKAVLHRTAGQPAEACWRRILTLRRPDQFCSVDQGIYGHLTLRNLAVLAEERGDLAGAEGCWRRVLAECPGDVEALAKLERFAQ